MTAARDVQQIEEANAAGRMPVVLVHGLWLLPGSWERWVRLLSEAGFAPIAPGWPDDPDTVAEAVAHPEGLANKTIGQIADHLAGLIGRLDRKPAVIGHSLGGLLTEILAGRGLAQASVAISPAPFRGVLPLPIAALRSALPVLRNPANFRRAVPLTYDQFRFAFANAVGEDEARELYETFSVPAPGAPVFQAATANLNPWTEARIDRRAADRGPLLVVAAGRDHTVPASIARASYHRQRRNPGVTEIVEVPDRGHSLVVDQGWRDIAEIALAFVRRHA